MLKDHSIQIDLFPDRIPEDIVFIFNTLHAKSYEVYLVGGAVRDMVLSGSFGETHLSASDFDFTTNADPNTVISVFQEASKNRTSGIQKMYSIPTGISHGTVTLVMEREDDSRHYEITTYRIDGIYKDGRHPENVRFASSLKEDLSRRDFTINALAYDVFEKKLYDPFNGINDLKHKIIRTVGNPLERFHEDGLRPVRACRIAAQLGFDIERETLKAMGESLDTVSKVSMERVHDELLKLMKASKPSAGLEWMRISGILDIFLPELLEGFQIDQNEYHKHDVYYHNLFTCDAVIPEKPLVRLAGLFHDIGKPRSKNFALANGNGNVFYNHEIISCKMAARILKRLKFSNSDSKIILNLVKMHMFYYTEEWSDGAVRRFLRKIEGDPEILADLFELRKADRIGSGLKSGDAEILQKFRKRIQSIIEADNALKVTDLDINGNDIMDIFELKPSRTIGLMLEYMLQRVLDNPEFNRKESLVSLGKEFLEKMESGKLEKFEDEDEDIEILV